MSTAWDGRSLPLFASEARTPLAAEGVELIL